MPARSLNSGSTAWSPPAPCAAFTWRLDAEPPLSTYACGVSPSNLCPWSRWTDWPRASHAGCCQDRRRDGRTEGTQGEVATLRAPPTIISEVAGHNAAAGGLLAAYGYTLYYGQQPAALRSLVAIAPPETWPSATIAQPSLTDSRNWIVCQPSRPS